MDEKLLTTGEAAERCSVTRDTILKWIRSGKLRARSTAGGHHRIHPTDLPRVRGEGRARSGEPLVGVTRPFRYCWEHNGQGKLKEGCKHCVVYRLRAHRCYEVLKLSPEGGHPKLFCRKTCDECDYYRTVHSQVRNVLVVTDDEALTLSLARGRDEAPFALEMADCEYSCATLVEVFRPDYVVIDCSLGKEQTYHICNHLKQDPRIPFVRVILAAKKGAFPRGCDQQVFARLQMPFGVDEIIECIQGTDPDGMLRALSDEGR